MVVAAAAACGSSARTAIVTEAIRVDRPQWRLVPAFAMYRAKRVAARRLADKETGLEVTMESDTTTSTDLDQLIRLNRDYVDSVQYSDVRRFQEILAEDFLCSNPDGALVDKRQFLQQT